MSSSVSPGRDLTFDFLRGGAVLYIVGYYHIQEIWVVGMPGAVAGWLARVALALFCFLSGYLLSGRTVIESWRGVGEFYRRRLLKIYPLYFLALLGFVKLGLIPVALFWPSALLVNTLLNWSLLTLWFISMIFLFYLVTPLFLWRPSVWKTCVVTLGLLVLLGLVRWSGNGVDPRLFPNLVAFALGILLTQNAGLRAFFLEPAPVVRSVSLFALIFLGALLWQTMPRDADPTHMLFALGFFVAALPWLMAIGRGLTRFFPAKAVEFLATASFVLYLSHRLIYRLGEQIWHAPTPLMRQFYYLGVLLPVALVLSYFVQRVWQRVVR